MASINQLHSIIAVKELIIMLQSTVILLLVVFAGKYFVFGEFQISVVKDPDSKLYLKYDFPVNKTLRLIPDETTVKELGFDPSALNGISSTEISTYQIGKPVESLITKVINPDEVLRVAIQRAAAMMPLKFTKFQKFGYFNPCIVAWNGR